MVAIIELPLYIVYILLYIYLFNAAFLLFFFSDKGSRLCHLSEHPIVYFLPFLQLLSQTKGILEDRSGCWLTLTGWGLTVRWILWQCSIYPYQFQYLLLWCRLNLWLNTLQLTVMICCLMSEHLLYKQMDQVSRCLPFKWIDNLTSHLRISLLSLYPGFCVGLLVPLRLLCCSLQPIEMMPWCYSQSSPPLNDKKMKLLIRRDQTVHSGLDSAAFSQIFSKYILDSWSPPLKFLTWCFSSGQTHLIMQYLLSINVNE